MSESLSPAHRTAIREALTDIVRHLFQRVTQNHWNIAPFVHEVEPIIEPVIARLLAAHETTRLRAIIAVAEWLSGDVEAEERAMLALRDHLAATEPRQGENHGAS